MAYKERWTVNNDGGGKYSFEVKQSGLAVGFILACIGASIVFGLGLIVLVIALFVKSKKYKFSVSPEGFVVGGKLIPAARINTYGIRNLHDGTIYNNASFEGAKQLSLASRAYRVTVQAGGGKVDLAKGLQAEEASGLVADIERALNGTL